MASPPLNEEEAADKRRSVLVLYTGGTIGMKRNGDGALAPVPGFFRQMLETMDELKNAEMPRLEVVEYDPLLDSACFTPQDWVKIANDIGRAYYHFDGFVVCMGTDTMSYAASAVSFMLENLGKTVVFTGSQIPLCEAYTDARRNLVLSLILAAKQEIPEVTVFFNDRLLRANRAVKANNRELGAFISPNFPPLATLGVHIAYRKDLALPPPRGPFRVRASMESNVIVVRLIPGFDDDALITLAKSSARLKAIVLELYGTGNSPNKRQGFLDFIQVARERDILIVAVTQCLHGGVTLWKYAVGAALIGLGVVSGGDMTTEAVVTKLAYLFGALSSSEAVAKAMQRDLRGELSPPESYAHEILRRDDGDALVFSKL